MSQGENVLASRGAHPRVERTLDEVIATHGAFLAAVEAGTGIGAAIATTYGWQLELFDPQMAVAQIDQIVVRRLNDFVPDGPRPRILDCGANIGISVLNFKRHAPGARIVAFEPDPLLCHTLRRNLKRNGADDVDIVEAAVWTTAGNLPFVSNGTDGGRIVLGEAAAQASTSVRTVALEDYLDERVDLLKLDVEGGEFALIDHLATRLQSVRNLIVECHITQATVGAFARLLAQLRESGFHVSFNTFGHWRDLIRQPALPPLYSEQYVAVYASRRVSLHADTVGSYLPYLELSLLTSFYRAYESHGGPQQYQRVHAAQERRDRTTLYLSPPFHHYGGRCWTTELPIIAEGDTLTSPDRSGLLLLEDGRPIGPPHCQHQLIERYGAGRFSHWNKTLFFSSSDGSDPNGNGRTYAVAVPLDDKVPNHEEL